jgi:pimeloyl-ACP methyl ester carboxylesterase
MRRFLPISFLFLLCAGLSIAEPARTVRRKLPGTNHSPVRAASEPLKVGSLTLRSCKAGLAYCGSIQRALDPSGLVPGEIEISFEFYPHTETSKTPLEPIVATEGGPGYATTGTASYYLDLFASLRDRRDMLFVDNRGTGKSQALLCPLLQKDPNPRPKGIFECGRQLGDAAYLYGSGLAADDLAAVLDALNIPLINLYGDSYGTWFSQTFAGRHPERLRSVILDSAYPVEGQSPWYPEIAITARFAFDAVCKRSLACSDLPGSSLDRIEKLVESLRANPFTGYAHDGDGKLRRIKADATALVYLMVSNATQSVVYRELDPAARAYLDDGNPAPLLRLLAENYFVSESGGANNYQEYSQATFVAVSCTDYPQIYDMNLGLEKRRSQRDQAIADQEQKHPKVYNPFTIAEFDGIPLDTSVLDLCLSWPPPVVTAYPPGHGVPPHAKFTVAPVLVLSGDLDSLTPALQGKRAAKLFEDGHQLVVPNSFHVTALADEDDCASVLARNFVLNLDPGDTSCLDHIAEVHLVPAFHSKAADVPPALAAAGNQGTESDLRVAAAAAYTVGDVLARWWVNYTGDGVGLMGGHFHYQSPGDLTYFAMSQIKWVDDVEVSGKMKWAYTYPGNITAHIRLAGAGTDPAALTISWQSRVPMSQAEIKGRIGKRKIAATMYAP